MYLEIILGIFLCLIVFHSVKYSAYLVRGLSFVHKYPAPKRYPIIGNLLEITHDDGKYIDITMKVLTLLTISNIIIKHNITKTRASSFMFTTI